MTPKQTNRIVALLPMKANSVRVKGKNFRSFCGKPLFRWILDTLLEIDDIDEVVINTDARDILAENGLTDTSRITIRDRKTDICGDNISMNLVLGDDVENVSADIFVMTHTTNPLISSHTIRHALATFREAQMTNQADSLFSVNKIQTRFYRADGSPVNHDPAHLIPTQELEPWYEENSNLYLFTPRSFQTTKARIGVKPILYCTPYLESVDIDNPEDWDFAEAAFRITKQR
jgi:CMP-N-acetylneuraminic acid synthetase